MKLTITKSSGTKLIKEFKDVEVESAKANGTKLIKEFGDLDISAAKANGWEELDKPKPKSKPKAKVFKKVKGGK